MWWIQWCWWDSTPCLSHQRRECWPLHHRNTTRINPTTCVVVWRWRTIRMTRSSVWTAPSISWPNGRTSIRSSSSSSFKRYDTISMNISTSMMRHSYDITAAYPGHYLGYLGCIAPWLLSSGIEFLLVRKYLSASAPAVVTRPLE